MENKYESPQIRILQLNECDIIRTSGAGNKPDIDNELPDEEIPFF